MSPREPPPSRSSLRRVVRLSAAGAARAERDPVVVEEPLEIRVGGRPWVVTMRTPGDDAALAAGLLATEGLLGAPAELARIAPCRQVRPEAAGNVVDVTLAGEASFAWGKARRNLGMSSACGLCGKERIEQVLRRIAPIPGGGPAVPLELLLSLPDRLRPRQRTFGRTGGLHAAALFTPRGRLVDLAEDVGRHNAVDKLLGRAFLAGGWPLVDRLMVVSGRASFEIVQKGAAAGIPVLASVSAPSTTAVDLARRVGMTLVGFLREGRGNVYSGEARVVGPAGGRARR